MDGDEIGVTNLSVSDNSANVWVIGMSFTSGYPMLHTMYILWWTGGTRKAGLRIRSVVCSSRDLCCLYMSTRVLLCSTNVHSVVDGRCTQKGRFVLLVALHHSPGMSATVVDSLSQRY